MPLSTAAGASVWRALVAGAIVALVVTSVAVAATATLSIDSVDALRA